MEILGTTESGEYTAYKEYSTIKFSASLATDDVAFVRDGLSAATDSSFVLPKFTRLQIGYHQFGSAWNNTISKIAFYPKRLPNATLQAMTEE